MPNFQNNFGTNLTAGTTAGDTTSPLNSIPSVAAPFYLAFDATNLNGHYEVAYITSKTATNVNHSNTAYNHTTAEEVRMVVPAVHLNTMQNFPEGFLINGKIVPSVASNNLTVALKTLAGADPSITDPVYCRIGDTVRAITAACSSVSTVAGLNEFNSGSAELATKEIDYFVYLGYNSINGVTIGFARIPYATRMDDFSTTFSNEKWFSTISNLAAGDVVENIGRFAATLSAGAGYTWSVPTFTTTNLIQRPIYETRELNWVPTLTSAADLSGYDLAAYKIIGSEAKIIFAANSKNITTSGLLTISAPLNGVSGRNFCFKGNVNNASAWVDTLSSFSNGTFSFYKTIGATTWAGSENGVTIQCNFEITL